MLFFVVVVVVVVFSALMCNQFFWSHFSLGNNSDFSFN